MPRNYNKSFRDKKDKKFNMVESLAGDKPNNSPQGKKEDTARSATINRIAIRDLPGKSVQIKTDPYTELNESSSTINLVAEYNKTYTPGYRGEMNLDGGKLDQYMTSSDSKFLRTPDASKLEVAINYRFLPLRPDLEGNIQNLPRNTIRGQAILNEMYLAINEAFSQMEVTVFKDLDFIKKYSCFSSIKLFTKDGTALYDNEVTLKYTPGDTTKVYYYTDPSAVVLLACIEYQVSLQQVAFNIENINKLKGYQKKMLKMNNERETARLNDLFGQYNRSAFINKLDSIKLNISGEYMDNEWDEQTKILASMISQEADDIIDPVLELIAVYNFAPLFALFKSPTDSKYSVSDFCELENDEYELRVGPSYADSKFKQKLAYLMYFGMDESSLTFNSRRIAYLDNSNQTQYTHLRNLSAQMVRLTSVYDTIKWSRSPEATRVNAATSRYNGLINRVDGLVNYLTIFKSSFTDLRTVINKLAILGINTWSKGVVINTITKRDLPVVNYLLVKDLYRQFLSGEAKFKFSVDLGRWISTTLFDKTYGIPMYDKISGGAFIAFSTKLFDANNSSESEVELMPVMLTCSSTADTVLDDFIHLVDRSGDEVVVSRYETAQTPTAIGLRRLAVLPSQENTLLYTPYIKSIVDKNGNDITATNDGKVVNEHTERVVINLCGILRRNGSNYFVSPDILFLYDFQLVNISNRMLNYAKAYGPVRGCDPTVETIGFKSLLGDK